MRKCGERMESWAMKFEASGNLQPHREMDSESHRWLSADLGPEAASMTAPS